jgi:16S rRNA (guanine527-N7)-methyltransferase
MMSLLKTALTENQLALNDETRTQLLHYLDALNKWNKVINLTSITDAREMVYLHVIDSLLLAPFLQGKRLLDVGTGGGLLPETEWVLLDKSAKKTRFLLQMKAELALHNVEIMTSRTEDFQPLVPFDCIVSRAYGTLRLLTEASKHLLSDQGRWCFMKGRYPIEELNDLPSFVKLLDVIPIKMQGMTVTRHVVRCRR